MSSDTSVCRTLKKPLEIDHRGHVVGFARNVEVPSVERDENIGKEDRVVACLTVDLDLPAKVLEPIVDAFHKALL